MKPLISLSNRQFTSEVKQQVKRKLPALDPNKDFKFFIERSKVIQVYREALKEAKSINDPETSRDMQ